MAKKYCYLFSEGNAKMRELLGGKGANLAEMTGMGLPVPQGFLLSLDIMQLAVFSVDWVTPKHLCILY